MIIEIRVKLADDMTLEMASDLGEEIKDLIYDNDSEYNVTSEITDVTYEVKDVPTETN